MANINVPPMIPLDQLREMKKANPETGIEKTMRTIRGVGAQVQQSVPKMEEKVLTLKLLGVNGTFAEKQFSIGRGVILGRDPKEANIVFPPETQGISRKHCSICMDKNGVLIKDLGSSMGTYLENGMRLKEGISYHLERGESFYLATTKEMYRII